MDFKDTLSTALTDMKASVTNFFISHRKKIIALLVLALLIVGGLLVYGQMELEKQANAPVIQVNLIEGQSYSIINPIKSYEFINTDKNATEIPNYDEFMEVNLNDQKIYGLANYTEGTISFLAKLEDNTYEKYICAVATLGVKLEQDVNVARDSTVAMDWDTMYTAEWRSTDEQVATVDQSGNVTGLDLGECDIIAKVTDEISVTYHVSVVDVALSPANPYIYVGDSLTYTVLGYRPAADEKMLIETEDVEIATVRGMKARGVKEGTTVITLPLNGKIYTSNLTVLGTPSVDDITLTVDTSMDVIAQNIPNFKDCESIKIANEAIATFENGTVFAHQIGETMVTGSIKGHEFSFKITVTGAALVPDPDAVYDTNYTKYNGYNGLVRYSVKENESFKIYFTNANANTPVAKTNDNNFRIFETNGEYIEIIGTNPGVGLIAIDFDDNRLYAEIHVQHTNATLTQRAWEIAAKTFTDTLKADGDWTFSDETHPAYLDAKSDLTRKINGLSMINYILQEVKLFHVENAMTLDKDGKITGTEETMQIVEKYMDIFGPDDISTDTDKNNGETLQLGDIVIWNDGTASIFMGKNKGNTLTWYEVNKELVEADGFMVRFYNETNKENLEISQVLRLHYTL